MRALSFLFALAILQLAAPAQASLLCSRETIERSDPADGARDVPRNQALALEGVFDPASLSLESEGGDAIPFELNAGPWLNCPGTSADVLPRSALSANTRYVLRVKALDGKTTSTLHFTTGTKTLPEISFAPPHLTASVIRGVPDEHQPTQKLVLACLGTNDTEQVELRIVRGREVLHRTTRVVSGGFYRLPKVPDCIELRRRLATGKRSEPVAVCGKQLSVRTWKGTAGERPSCEDGIVRSVRAPTPKFGSPFRAR
ncbi:MAG: Ig-like domain-containing protein [Polyangiales bacterium]